jgi:hypothetical protein
MTTLPLYVRTAQWEHIFWILLQSPLSTPIQPHSAFTATKEKNLPVKPHCAPFVNLENINLKI